MKRFFHSISAFFILASCFSFSLHAENFQSVQTPDGEWIFVTKTADGADYENLYVQNTKDAAKTSLILENPAKLPLTFSNLCYLPKNETLYFSIHNGSEFVNGVQLFRGEGIYVLKKDSEGNYSSKGLRRFTKLEPWLVKRAKIAFIDNLSFPDYTEFLDFLFEFADFDVKPVFVYTSESGKNLLNEEAVRYLHESKLLDKLVTEEKEYYHSVLEDFLFCLDENEKPTEKPAVTANHCQLFYREGSSFADYHFFMSFKDHVLMLTNLGSMKNGEWSLDFSKVYLLADSGDDFLVSQPQSFAEIKAEVFETPFPKRLDSAPMFIHNDNLYLRDVNHTEFHLLQKDFSFKEVSSIQESSAFLGWHFIFLLALCVLLQSSVIFLLFRVKNHRRNEEQQEKLIRELTERVSRMEKKSLFIVDSHTMLSNGLKNYLEENSSWNVAEIFTDSEDCLSYLSKITGKNELPEIIIVNAQLQELSGFELVEKISQTWPDIKCLVYSMDDNPGFILQSSESGAKGFISKTAPETELLTALETISSGGIYIEKRLEKVQEKLASTIPLFSKQEKIIFEKLLQGKTNKEIAEEMFISVHSVENYVSFIYDKTFVKNRKELIQQFQ